MFALDSFDPKLTIWQQIGGFLIHLIPTYILILLLFIAWKWEMIGGIIFTAIGLIFAPVLFIFNYHGNHSVGWSLLVVLCIPFPFIVIGVLFIISHYRGKKTEKIPTSVESIKE
jgi:hypothetical protein